MSAQLLVSVVAVIVGGVVYLASSKPRLAELGRLTFVAGAVAALLQVGSRVLRL